MVQPPFAAITLSWPTASDFLTYWAPRYDYPNADHYAPHIGRPLTERRLWALFTWKNGGAISQRKRASITANYPVRPPTDPAARYLDPRQPGGAVWNIFYLHCLDPARWPIYDQHTHRAMVWILAQRIEELPASGTVRNKARIYESYQERYRPFLAEHFPGADRRTVDRALFAFGRFLKRIAVHLQDAQV